MICFLLIFSLKSILKSISKGNVYANFKVIKGKLNPRATYYFTFDKANVCLYEPDAVLLAPNDTEEMYFYKIER